MRSFIPPVECAQARERTSLRLDTELSEFEASLLDAHLAGCADCRAFADDAAQVAEALRSAPLERPSLTFELPRWRRRHHYGARVASAAAAVAVVGLSSLVGLQFSSDGVRVRETVGVQVLTLKERQLAQLDNAGRAATRPVTRAVAGRPTGLDEGLSAQ